MPRSTAFITLLFAGGIALSSAACDTKRSQAERRRQLAAASPPPVVRVAQLQPVANARLIMRGQALFRGRAGCASCHKVGNWGAEIKGPNLGVGDGMDQAIGVRGASRVGNVAAIDYIIDSIVDPDGYIVKGYVKGIMKRTDEPPISLREDEIVALATYLMSVGSNVGVSDTLVDSARARIPLARRFRHQRRIGSSTRATSPAK